MKMRTKKILVIYTGGTFGMVVNSKGVLAPQHNVAQVIKKLPQLFDEEYWTSNLAGTDDEQYLALPSNKDTDIRIFYKIHEYENLKDSSDFTIDDWLQQGRDIQRFYHEYDGFVILHGTDTMAYGACLLSFMFETIGKPVVLTGAQAPIIQPRSDGTSNFLCALLIAATQNIPEVTVYFYNKLFRGCRVKKISNIHLNAFDSPNFPALLEEKISLEVDRRIPRNPLSVVPDGCTLSETLSRKVYMLRVLPTITPEIIRAVCKGMDGVVLESYGAGNIPISRTEIYQELQRAVNNQVLVVNVTQCINGTVLGKAIYETGRLLMECGVIPAFDMTVEATFAKLSYVLGKKELSYKQKVELMKRNIRGELHNPDHESN